MVETKHLKSTSKEIIKIMCDSCKKTQSMQNHYYQSKYKNNGNLFMCVECTKNKDKYGNPVITEEEIKDIKTKTKKKNLLDAAEKRRLFYVENYGVENPSQLESVKQKKRETCLKNYGVEIPAYSSEIAEKTRQTNLNRHGVEYPQQSEDIRSKTKKSLYENGTTKTSRQQKYIHNIVGGELNYPIKTINLDIAFVDDKIYIEYNGGGHRLRIKLGAMTEDQFEKWEKKRWYVLKRKGWKEIRIESEKDYLPNEDKIVEMVSMARSHFSDGHSWIEFNIEEKVVKTSSGSVCFDFGMLKYINRQGEINNVE